MQQEKTVTISYGLREIAGERRLVGLEFQSTGNATCCGEQDCTLTFAEGATRYRAATARGAQRTLVVNTDWFNSDAQRPSWGRVDASTLEVVEITEVLEIAGVPLPRPVVFTETLEVFSKSREVCGSYLGRDLPAIDTHWVMRLVYVPADETLDSLTAKCTEATVFLGKKSQSECYAWGVVAVPGELQSEVEPGRLAVLLCTSTNHPEDFTDVGEPD